MPSYLINFSQFGGLKGHVNNRTRRLALKSYTCTQLWPFKSHDFKHIYDWSLILEMLGVLDVVDMPLIPGLRKWRQRQVDL